MIPAARMAPPTGSLSPPATYNYIGARDAQRAVASSAGHSEVGACCMERQVGEDTTAGGTLRAQDRLAASRPARCPMYEALPIQGEGKAGRARAGVRWVWCALPGVPSPPSPPRPLSLPRPATARDGGGARRGGVRRSPLSAHGGYYAGASRGRIQWHGTYVTALRDLLLATPHGRRSRRPPRRCSGPPPVRIGCRRCEEGSGYPSRAEGLCWANTGMYDTSVLPRLHIRPSYSSFPPSTSQA
ncbi:hypothetical protein B0H14DRAFT_1210676 [Mycena olivaceomarginata]|nr:hypothetical protein B0H14DRAFT_1210676 [Mycena olivaceomarginata]